MMAVIRRLNYQHLLYFWSVVRTGSLTRACEELALSAPTISAQLHQWLDKHDVRPVMIGEFEDYALLREFARAGHGAAAVPSIMEEQFRREYGFARIGVAAGIRSEFYAVSVERKIRNPAIAAMIEHAREAFVATA